MEGFTYSNIFETKGIEYIIIISFLCLLVPVWFFISKPAKVKEQIRNAINVLTAGVLRIPQGLFFSKNHTWVHLQKSGEAKIGLDDFLVSVIGDFKITPLLSEGDKVQKNDIVAIINQKGKKLMVHSPISGEIVGTNAYITEDSELFNRAPYEQGWLYSVKPANWRGDTSGFYLGKNATKWITKELERFKDFLNVSIGKHSGQPSMVTLQEGGELRMNPLEELQSEIWLDFQKEFLD